MKMIFIGNPDVPDLYECEEFWVDMEDEILYEDVADFDII